MQFNAAAPIKWLIYIYWLIHFKSKLKEQNFSRKMLIQSPHKRDFDLECSISDVLLEGSVIVALK